MNAREEVVALGRRFRDYICSPAGGSLFAALGALLLLLLVWWQAGLWYEEQLLTDRRAQVLEETSLRANALSLAINRSLARMQGLYAFVQSEADAAEFEPKFESFAAQLYGDSQGIRNFAVTRGGEIRYVYPLAGNEVILGHNLITDPRPNVRADVERALRTRAVTISGPYELQQGGQGVIARRALYQGDAFWGLVTMALDVQPLIDAAELNTPHTNLAFALRDGTGRVFFGPADIFQHTPTLHRIGLPEGAWELASVPQGGWQAAIRTDLTLFQGGGLIIVSLLVSVVYLTFNHQARLARAVAQRTQEISAVNIQLEEDIAERTRVEAALREREEQYRNIFESSSDGLFINDLETGRLVDFNPAAACMHGYTPEEFRHIQPPQFIHPDSFPMFGEYLQAVRTGGQFRGRAIDIRKDGTPFHVEVFGTYFTFRGKPHTLAVVRDVTEEVQAHQLLEQRVAERTRELYEQARALVSLEERQRLARELHDSVSQALYGIALGARTGRALLDRDPARAAEPLDYVLSLAEAGLAEMRALIFELRPESLEAEGLAAALIKQAAAIRARHGLEVNTFFCEEPAAPLAVKEALYRIAQEALNNVIKHAQATRVELCLDQTETGLTLDVRDNGVGFDAAGPFPGHLGLMSMRERAEHLGGVFTIESAPGAGSLIRVHIPEVFPTP